MLQAILFFIIVNSIIMAVTNYDLECCNEIGEPVSRPGCTANKYDKAPSTLQTDLYGNVSPNFFPQIQIRISEESDIIFTLVFLAECFIQCFALHFSQIIIHKIIKKRVAF